MVAQARDLIAQRSCCNAILIALPILPALPGVAASPAGHDENTQLVSFVEELVAIEAAFQTNGVEMHVADVGEVSIEPRGRPTEEQVGSPSGAENQELASIDLEEAMAFVGEFGGDFANAEG